MIPITEKIFFIEGMNQGRYTFSNSLYINDDIKAIIDTGVGKQLLRNLIKKNLGNEEILIINSHCHEDHIFGNYIFKNSKIAIHYLDAPILKSIDKLLELYGLSDPKFKEMNDNFFAIFNLRNYPIDTEFDDNFIFDLGETKLQVIHTPGHSAGHCCFYEPQNKILFLSDIDLSSFGPFYGAIDCSIDNFIESINKVIKINPEIVVSSHKGIFKEGIIEKLNAFLEKIYEREEKILDFLDIERNLDEIVKKALIYGKFPEPKAFYEIAERIMIELHLERLLKANKIQKLPYESFIKI